MLGALGGFFLPPILGSLGRATGIPQMAFVALLLLTAGCLAWLHVTVLRLRSAAATPRDSLIPVSASPALALESAAERTAT